MPTSLPIPASERYTVTVKKVTLWQFQNVDWDTAMEEALKHANKKSKPLVQIINCSTLTVVWTT